MVLPLIVNIDCYQAVHEKDKRKEDIEESLFVIQEKGWEEFVVDFPGFEFFVHYLADLVDVSVQLLFWVSQH